jgi:hypothetical protein
MVHASVERNQSLNSWNRGRSISSPSDRQQFFSTVQFGKDVDLEGSKKIQPYFAFHKSPARINT